MAGYTVHLTVTITPDVDASKLQMTLNSYAREAFARSVRVGISAALLNQEKPSEPICQVKDVTVVKV